MERDAGLGFILQHRALEPGAPHPTGYPHPISIVSELGLQFCPWCGVNLKKWYKGFEHTLDKSNLRIPY